MTRRAALARLVLVSLVLLGGYGVRVWRLNAEPVWHDEGWSIRAIRNPIETPDDNTPIVYYGLGHMLLKLGTGETPFALRYSSVLLGLLTVAVAIRIGQHWYGTGAGLAAGVLVGSSPLLWEYAQEVRAYVAVPLVALLMLGVVDKLLAHDSGQRIPRYWWGALFGIELIGLYTHNLVVPLIVWLNVAAGWWWLWQRDWKRLIIWAGLHLALIVSYIPWLLTQSPSGTPINTIPAWGLALVQDVWYSYFLPVLPQLQAAGQAWELTVAGLGLVALGAWLVVAERSRRTWLLTTHAILVPVFSTVLLRAAHIDFHPRYYIAAVPGTLLLAVAAIATLDRIAGSWAITAGYVMAAAGSLMLAQGSLHDIATTRAYQHDDFAGLAAYYASLPDDVVILVPFDREPALQDYYAPNRHFLNIDLYATGDNVLTELAALDTSQVEFLTWFQLPADVRGMYPCLLGANSKLASAPRDFYGLRTQSFTLDAGAYQFQDIAAGPRFAEVELVGMGWMASSQAICVRNKWRLLEPSSDDIEIALRLTNTYGWILDQHDETLRDHEQVSTRHWSSDQTGTAYHQLRLPAGAPSAAYGLELSVYNTSVPSGLDVLAANGASLGKIYRLDDAVRTNGPPLPEPVNASRLVESNAGASIESGALLKATILLESEVDVVALVGQDWELRQSIEPAAQPQLSWHIFQVPFEAEGEAQLVVNDADILATYTITRVERLYTPPAFDIALDAEFTGVAHLVGTTTPTTVSPAQPPAVSLVWRATNTPTTAYTVFVQLLDDAGRLIAQSDQQPQRPTLSWVPDEYIVDNHRLNFVVEDYEGAAHLIVGFYDPKTFDRVLTTDQLDHARLPLDIRVEQ